jgi:hypothetical protein
MLSRDETRAVEMKEADVDEGPIAYSEYKIWQIWIPSDRKKSADGHIAPWSASKVDTGEHK